MPPTLDLSGTKHSKMVISPPRINLRRAASYNHADRGPLSSTSSRFNFNHLVFNSPPPSPRLPTLVPPRPRKPSNAPRPSRVFKTLFWLFGLGLMFYLGASSARRYDLMRSLEALTQAADGVTYEMVGQDDLPDFPTPVIIHDRKGTASWTVSIPPTYSFPLSLKEYADVYSKCREVSARVREIRQPGKGAHHESSFRHGSSDRHFVDVSEAEKAGLLPGILSDTRVSSHKQHRQDGQGGSLVGESKDSHIDSPVCSTSLTFVLESKDGGIGRSLMMLWTAYGLAQRQGRAFFVDDTRWAYGSYTSIFKPPPSPPCRSPRRHEMLPCPFQARHLVVTARTADDWFAASLAGEDSPGPSESPSSPSQQRTRFDLAREGYQSMFSLNSDDDKYVAKRVDELLTRTQSPNEGENDGIIIGIHVRRGDRHPVEYQYRDSYMPLNLYSEQAHRILDLTYSTTGAKKGRTISVNKKGNGGGVKRSGKERSLLVLASDDPMVYESEEFAGAVRAQEQIKLASKAAIQKANPDRSVMHKFVDETFGWEGGFFAAMFWNLGLPSASASSGARLSSSPMKTVEPSPDTMKLRSLIGRAYMMDLAVLARTSDVVICTVSAMGCRLLAVMMGWEKAIGSGYWVNIDGDYGWDGDSSW